MKYGPHVSFGSFHTLKLSHTVAVYRFSPRRRSGSLQARHFLTRSLINLAYKRFYSGLRPKFTVRDFRTIGDTPLSHSQLTVHRLPSCGLTSRLCNTRIEHWEALQHVQPHLAVCALSVHYLGYIVATTSPRLDAFTPTRATDFVRLDTRVATTQLRRPEQRWSLARRDDWGRTRDTLVGPVHEVDDAGNRHALAADFQRQHGVFLENTPSLAR